MNQAVLFSGWGTFLMVGNGCRTRRQCVFVSTDHTYSKAHLQCVNCHVPLPMLVKMWKMKDQRLFTTWLLERKNMQRSRRGTPWHCCREIRSQALHTSLLYPVLRPQQPYSKSLCARPKESKLAHTKEPGQLHEVQHTFSSLQPMHISPRSARNNTVFRDPQQNHMSHNVHTTHTSHGNIGQNVNNILQQQTEITAQLVQQHHSASLPPRVITVSDSDTLKNGSFIRDLEQSLL